MENDMVIRRNRYLERLISKQNNGMIKVITGIRRSGKSYLLFNLFYDHLLASGTPEDNIICIALDDVENEAYRELNKARKLAGNDTDYIKHVNELQKLLKYYFKG